MPAMQRSASTSRVVPCSGLLAVETAGRRGLGLLAVVSAVALLGSPTEGKAGRHSASVHAAPSSIEWVAAPQADVALTAAPAVTTPTHLAGPPDDRDPMVLAAAILDHHHLVILSLRGGLYGP